MGALSGNRVGERLWAFLVLCSAQPCWGKTLGLSRAMFGATALERGSTATSEGRGGEKHCPTTRALLMLEGRGPPRALGDTHGDLGQVLWRSDR